MSKNIKLKNLLTERKLDEFDKARVEESLERLNKYHATLNKLWPQIQKSTAKTKWSKAKDAAYGLMGLGKNLYRYLGDVEDILKRPGKKGEQENMLKLKDLLESHHDRKEGKMAKYDVKEIFQDAKDVFKMIDEEDDLPEWLEAKITKAADYMNSVKDYLTHHMGKEKE